MELFQFLPETLARGYLIGQITGPRGLQLDHGIVLKSDEGVSCIFHIENGGANEMREVSRKTCALTDIGRGVRIKYQTASSAWMPISMGGAPPPERFFP